MLAYCWESDEATAIWLEIVAERKSQLEAKTAQAEWFDLSDAVSSKVSLDKDQLAAWDNSARAWLAAANESPVVQQRQKAVRCLLDKVNATVQSQQGLFTSVTKAWTVALETLEKIICGMSCSITDGAVIVALLSWHVYPDLILLSPKVQEIKQHDGLIKTAGQITIGLIPPSSDPDFNQSGVHWSLSLGHLRYYGTAEVTSRSLHCTPSGGHRFTFDEFLLIYIGSRMRLWSFRERITLQEATDFVINILSKFDEILFNDSPPDSDNPLCWIRMFNTVLEAYKNGIQADHSRVSRFLALGWRSPRVSEDGSPYRSLGLSSTSFSRVLRNKSDRASYEQESIQDYLSSDRISKHPFIILVAETFHDTSQIIIHSRYLKLSHLLKEKSVEAREHPDGGFIIDIQKGTLTLGPPRVSTRWANPPRSIVRLYRKGLNRPPPNSVDVNVIHLQKIGLTSSHTVFSPGTFAFRNDYEFGVPYRRFQHYLSTRDTDPIELERLLLSLPTTIVFSDLCVCQKLYASLPGATISPSILESKFPIIPARDSRSRSTLTSIRDTLGFHFRLIAHLETGDPDIFTETREWHNIFALSTENTLYLHPALAGNPKFGHSSGAICRVQGNVGLPGFTLIGIPDNIEDVSLCDIKKPDANKWNIVNHHKFDGDLSDEFSTTTLHLRLTGYSYPLPTGPRSTISKATFVEAAISAFDVGEWIGDLDVFRVIHATTDPYDEDLRVVPPNPQCRGNAAGRIPERDLVAIENWEELLNPHPGLPAVVKCHGNWQARLAVISICLQLDYRIIVFDSHGCWDCAFEVLDSWDRAATDLEGSTDSQEESGDEASSKGDDKGEGKEDKEESDGTTRIQQGDSNIGISTETDIAEDKSESDDDFSSLSELSVARYRPSARNEQPVVFIL